MLRVRDFRFRRVSLLGLLAALTVSTAMAESVVIKRKFEAGSSYLFESKIHATRVMSGIPNVPKGESIKMQFDTVLCRREQVKDGAMGKKEVTATFERAVQIFDMPMMGGTLEFDSDDAENEEAAPLLATIFGPMVGESIKYEVGRDGKVLNFSGMDEIAKKIDAKATMNMFWTEMKSEFTDKVGRRQYAEDPLMIYPGKEVAVGDTWSATSKQERPRTGTVVENVTYKLDRIGTENGRKVAFISYTIDESSEGGDVDKKADDAKGEKKGSGTKVKGSGKGKAIYDIELGVIVSNETDSKSDIRMSLSEVGGGEGTMKISIAVKSNTRMISEADRNKQKEEAAQKIAARKKAQAEEEAEDEEDDDEDDDDSDGE
ncbi:MAG: hypothetical protein B6D36_01395 [Planctomycetes bacterium UTPLA1]|nr:MAG: hypothetical protein B6D36_01395 [Planctomycetes bacterium UTPLA1]